MHNPDLIYDWNQQYPPGLKPLGPVLINDETLRDGLQSPSVRDPSVAEKIEILHWMEELGIQSLALGLPGAGPRAVESVTALAREIASQKMKIRANCAARTHENDIRPIAEIVQKTGLRIEAATFIGSSPIRRFTEGWTEDFLLQTTEKAVRYAVSLGLDVMYVTEDTTRCDPETVKKLYSTAIRCGARAICICDTAGHATPMGALALVRFVVEEVVKPSGDAIRVDWHAPWDQQDLSKLKPYCQAVSRATGVPIPANYPVMGDDAFRTATGVHAAAIIKAYRKDDALLANTVYSGVPSHLFGLDQVIDIGPMSGKSNVLWWLERRGIPAADEVVDRIYQRAKQSDHTLSEAEILECVPAATHKK